MTGSSISDPNIAQSPNPFLEDGAPRDDDTFCSMLPDLESVFDDHPTPVSPSVTSSTVMSPSVLKLDSNESSSNNFLDMHHYLSNKTRGNLNGRLDDFANLLILYQNNGEGLEEYKKSMPSFSGGSRIPFFRKNEYERLRNALLSFSDSLKKQYDEYKHHLFHERDAFHPDSSKSIEIATMLLDKTGETNHMEAIRIFSS